MRKLSQFSISTLILEIIYKVHNKNTNLFYGRRSCDSGEMFHIILALGDGTPSRRALV